MLGKIKVYAGRGLSSLAAATMFVVMLPVTFGLMLMMLAAGVVTFITMRHRLRKNGVEINWPQKPTVDTTTEGAEKPPIEGTYTVVRD